MKVLLVDDAVEIRRSYGERIRRIDGVAEVDCVDGIEPGLALLGQRRYDVLVVDVQLRGNERGIDLVRHAAAHDAATAIVVLSNFGWQSMREGFLRLGAAAYFEKGTEAQELIAWIGDRARDRARRRRGGAASDPLRSAQGVPTTGMPCRANQVSASDSGAPNDAL